MAAGQAPHTGPGAGESTGPGGGERVQNPFPAHISVWAKGIVVCLKWDKTMSCNSMACDKTGTKQV